MFLKENKKNKQYLTNEEITIKSARVIAEDGEDLGVISVSEALRIASEQNLDLVAVSLDSNPAVCKILNYSRMKYLAEKKNKKAGQQKTVSKVVKIKPNIDSHDFERKLSEIQKFIDKKFVVTVTIELRGRQKLNRKVAVEKLGIVKKTIVNAEFKENSKIEDKFTLNLMPLKTKE